MNLTSKISPEMAEILGAFIGDGWIEMRGSALYIAGSPEEDKEYYDNFLAPLFSKHFFAVKPRLFHYWGVYGIALYRRDIINKALKMGFHKGEKATSIQIPEYIMIGSVDVKIALLRGIFDADGSFYCMKKNGKYDTAWAKTHHAHPRLALSTVSRELMTQIRAILDELQIEHKIDILERGFRCNRNRSTTYRLWINKFDSIQRWFDIVGTSNPRLKSRYEVWKQLGYLPPHTTHNYRKAILEAIHRRPNLGEPQRTVKALL